MENLVIDLQPILGLAVDALQGLLLALGAWVATKVAQTFGLENDDKIRGYLDKAVVNAIEFGEKKAREEVKKADWAKIETKNAMVAHAAGYVLSKVPDAVKRFKLTEDDVKDLVTARLGEK